jgi:hypothetical protein
MTDRWFPVIVGAVVACAVVVGLLSVGSPRLAREDRLDRHRLEQLRRLAGGIACRDRTSAVRPVLPANLTLSTLRAYCPSANFTEDDLTDDETGAPFVLNRLGDHEFEICAAFYDAGSVMIRASSSDPYWFRDLGFIYHPDTGCISLRQG